MSISLWFSHISVISADICCNILLLRRSISSFTWVEVGWGGAGRSSGSWSADPQGPGITGYIDGNAAERAPSDPHWETQTPLYTPSKKFLRMFGFKKNCTLSARFLSVSVTKLRFQIFRVVECGSSGLWSADPQDVVEFACACAVYSRQQRAYRSNQFWNTVNKNLFSRTAPLHVESAFENNWNCMNKN